MAIILGQVVDSNNNPVGGATIFFVSSPVNMPDIAQLTDSNGRFTIYVPVSGRYIIGSRSDKLGVVEAPIAVQAEKTFLKLKFKDE